MVEFIVSARKTKLVAMVREERIHLFCTRTSTEVILIDDA